jgi:hypothetical protein
MLIFQSNYRPEALLEQYRCYTQPTPFNANLPKTDYPYGEKAFEASPLNRGLKQAAPGESWLLNSGYPVVFAARTSTMADSIWRWRVAPGKQRNGMHCSIGLCLSLPLR